MVELHLTGIEVFAFAERGVEGQALPVRRGVLKLSCGRASGWSECTLCGAAAAFDLVRWSAFLVRLRRLTVEQAFLLAALERARWGAQRAALVETALRSLEASLGLQAGQRAALAEPALLAREASVGLRAGERAALGEAELQAREASVGLRAGERAALGEVELRAREASVGLRAGEQVAFGEAELRARVASVRQQTGMQLAAVGTEPSHSAGPGRRDVAAYAPALGIRLDDEAALFRACEAYFSVIG